MYAKGKDLHKYIAMNHLVCIHGRLIMSPVTNHWTLDTLYYVKLKCLFVYKKISHSQVINNFLSRTFQFQFFPVVTTANKW